MRSRISRLVLATWMLALMPLPSVWATDKCGAICDETWDLAGSPYVATCNLIVTPGCSLDIDAGVTVRFQAGYELIVNDGDLNVAGGVDLPVVFTSEAPTPAPGDWSGINLLAGATATFDWAEIAYAYQGLRAFSATPVTIDNSTIRDSLFWGVWFEGGALTMTNATLMDNASLGVYFSDGSFTLEGIEVSGSTSGIIIDGAAVGTLTGYDGHSNIYGLRVFSDESGNPTSVDVSASSITGNDFGVWLESVDQPAAVDPVVTVTGSTLVNATVNLYAANFRNAAGTVVSAGGNWWGTTDAAAIAAKILDRRAVSTSPAVDWCRYLDGPPPQGGVAHDFYCPGLAMCDQGVAWNATDQPYLLASVATICPTATLDIGPGVTVRAVEQGAIEVEGVLNVNGTASAPVALTSQAAAPAPYAWTGLIFTAGSTGSIDWAEIAYATTGIESSSAAVSLANSTFSDVGQGVEASAGTLEVTQSVVASNVFRGFTLTDGVAFSFENVETNGGGIGAWIDGAATGTLTSFAAYGTDTGLLVDGDTAGRTSVNVTGSSFTGNLTGVFVRNNDQNPASINPDVAVSASVLDNSTWNYYTAGFHDPDTTVLPAVDNWWGTADSTAIAAKVFDHFASSPTIDWCRYLDAPPPAGVLAHRAYCPDLQVCGGNEAWNATDHPYLITSRVRVCPTGTLDIGPGASLNVVPGFSSIQVEGVLNVNGTDAAPVSLASNSASPAPGDWTGVEFMDGATGSIEGAEVIHAYWGVQSTSATVSITGSSIHDTSAGGVEAEGGSLDVTGTTLTDNGDFGIRVDDGASFALASIETSSNLVGVGVRNAATGTIVDSISHSNTYGLSVLPGANGASTVHVGASRFYDNTIGVNVSGGGNGFINPQVVVSASSLYDNADLNLLAAGGWEEPESATLWAPDNWWGTTDPAAIAAGIYDREDSPFSPRVVTRPFGSGCDVALGRDADGDAFGDFEDNCPDASNSAQSDTDGDGMGDACDPDPAAPPDAPCDGLDDTTDGFTDSDGDGWGDPCDFHPLRADSYPGAPELCDGRDNDGDLAFASGELIDDDEDNAVACLDLGGDCDDADPAVFPCACERCANAVDDDCDGDTDAADATCILSPYCLAVTPGSNPLELAVDKGACSQPIDAGPYEVIRGFTAGLSAAGASVNLGDVSCTSSDLMLDRVTDLAETGDPVCDAGAVFWLVAPSGAADFGAGSAGQPRDVSNPDPACP